MINNRVLVWLTFAVHFFGSTAAKAADPSIIVHQPVGQATGDTCQSYVLALALAFKRDASFPLRTASDLREAETAIRAHIVAEYKKDFPNVPKPEPTHKHIARGFAGYTGGKYQLAIKDVSLPALSDVAGTRTGITGEKAVPPNFLLGTVVKDVLISSAKQIGKDTYRQGHLFTILGISGPPNSQRKFLVLNSAVKGDASTQNACENGIPDDPGPYTASVSWRGQSEIQFKQFGASLKAFTVEKVP